MNYWPKCEHVWNPTGKIGDHAYAKGVTYVRCIKCGQNGYQEPHRHKLTYTWVDHDPPVGLT